MDSSFIGRICYVSNRAKKDGYEDVAAWMQKHLTADLHTERQPRARGVKVKLAKARNALAILDEARVKELMP